MASGKMVVSIAVLRSALGRPSGADDRDELTCHDGRLELGDRLDDPMAVGALVGDAEQAADVPTDLEDRQLAVGPPGSDARRGIALAGGEESPSADG
jgi:hypothetical protein